MSEHIVRLSSQNNYNTVLQGTVAPRKFIQLTDVNMIGVQEGDIVTYDAATNTFIPGANKNYFISTSLYVSGIGTISGVILDSENVYANNFYGNLVGIASTAIDVIGGIGSLTTLYVTGVSTLPYVYAGIVTANTFYGNLIGTATTSVNISGGIGDLTALTVSGISSLGDVYAGNIQSGIITATEFYGNLTGNADTATTSFNVVGGVALVSSLDVSGISTLPVIEATNITAGVITATTFIGTATTATKLENIRTFEITGDIVASPQDFDGTQNVSLASSIQPNTVGLGTHTYGDYVKNITGTTGEIEVSITSGEGVSPQIGLPNNLTIGNNLTVNNDLQVSNNLNVTGNITIGGTTAFIVVNDFRVKDADIVTGFTTDINGNEVSNDTTANHGGISVASTEGSPLVSIYNPSVGEYTPPTYKKIMWFKTNSFVGLNTDAWLINYGVGIGSTQVPFGVRLAVGGVQLTDNDISVVRDVNASGITTSYSFRPSSGYIQSADGTNSFYIYNGTGNVAFQGNINVGQINSGSGYKVIGLSETNSSFENNVYISGITTSVGGFYGNLTGTATTSTNVIGGIGSLSSLSVSGVSTLGIVTSSNIFSTGIVTATRFVGVGASLTYTQSGTGAISRTFANKFSELISVKDYGAVGDGVTDDTAAIQAAVDANRRVYIPYGNYKISSAITLTNGYSCLIGDPRKPRFTIDANNGPAVKITATGSSLNEFSYVENLILFCNGIGTYSPTPDSTNCGLAIDGSSATVAAAVQRTTVRNCRILGFSCGINLSSHVNTKLEDIFIEHSTNWSSQVGYASTNLYVGVNFDLTPFTVGGISPQASCEVNRVVVNGNGAPSECTSQCFRLVGLDPRDIFFNNCETVGGNYAWYIQPTSNNYNIDVHINRPIIDAVKDTGIFVSNWGGYGALSVNGGYIVKNSNNTGSAIRIENSQGVYVQGMQILGVSLNNTQDEGIRVYNSNSIGISNNIFENCNYGITLENSANSVVSGNIISASNNSFETTPTLTSAINLISGSNLNVINSNNIKGASNTYKYTTGISVDATCPNNVIVGNSVNTSTVNTLISVNNSTCSVFSYNSLNVGSNFTVNASGNTGIGNTNPGAKLDVAGDIRLSLSDPEIEFNNGGPRFKVPLANNLSVHTGGGLNSSSSEVVRFNNTGVGIGTTNPTSKLHVIGDTNISGNITVSNINSSGIATLSNILASSLNVSGITTSTGGFVGNLTGNLNSSGINTATTLLGTDLNYSGIGTITSLISTNTTLTNINSSGVSTFTNGPVLIGSGTSTGTATQRLQVTGNAYVSGNLGVGNTNPGAKLDVTGNIRLSGANPNIEFNNGGAMVYGPLANTLAFASGGTPANPSEKMRISSSGNVGIGSTIPRVTLDVNGNAIISGIITATTFAGNLSNTLTLTTSGTGISGSATYNNSGASTFTVTSNATSNNTSSTIVSRDASGNFSAGVITATLSGNADTSTYSTSSGVSTNIIGGIASVTSLSVSGISTLGITSATNLTAQQLNVSGIATVSNNLVVNGGTLFVDSINNRVGINTLNPIQPLQVGSGSSIVVIDAQGELGIGTTNPRVALDVFGNASISGVITASSFSGNASSATYATSAGVSTSVIGGIGSIAQLQVSGVSTFSSGPVLIGAATSTGTATQRLQVTGGAYVSGSVGIGTTLPAAGSVLHVLGGIIRNDASGGNGGLSFWNGASFYGSISPDASTNIVLRADTTRSLIFQTGGANDRGRINADGIFLVGTATSTGTATQPLQVTGGAYVSGSIGVGITNPQTKFDVIGNARINGATSRSSNGLTVGFTNNTTFVTNSDVGDGVRTLSLVNESATTNAMSVLGFRVNPGSGTANAMMDMRYVQTGATNTSALHYTFNHGGSFFDRFSILSSGNVGVGTISPASTLQVKDALAFETTNTTTTTTNQVAIDSFSTTVFRSAKYQAQITCPGQISTLGGITTGGRGYTAGTFNITFTTSSGTGSAAQGTLTISNGTVGQVSVSAGGTGYLAGDVLTAGGGSGFQVSVGTTDAVGAILTLGAITSAGIGYTAGVGVGTTSLTFLGGTGTGAVGLATIFDGVITSSTLLQQPTTGTGGTTYYAGSNYTVSSVLTIATSDVTNTITDISGSVGVSTFTSLTAHGLFVNDIIRTSSTSNGLTAGTNYFVVTTPTSTTFTLGTSIGVGVTFTTGTGLAIGFFRNSANAGGSVAYTNAITAVATNYQVSDLLVLQNGTDTDFIEYGTIANNDVLGSFASDISGGNARLLFTPTYPNNTIKVARQAITL